MVRNLLDEYFENSGEWDQLDTFSMILYRVTTKVQIGDIPVGTKFSSISIFYDQGILEFYDGVNDKPVKIFEFDLTFKAKQ